MTDSAYRDLLLTLLLDAAADEFAAELANPEPPAVSSRFERQMHSMCCNPKKWAKRHTTPLWKKCLQTAAVFLLVATLSLGAVMAVSPTARAAIITWVIERCEISIDYRFTEQLPMCENTLMPRYTIGNLADGYQMVEEDTEWPDRAKIYYENADGKTLLFRYAQMYDGNTFFVGTDHMIVSDITVNGCPGQLFHSTNNTQSSAIVWMDSDSNLQFMLDGFLSDPVLLHMAESVKLSH